MFAEIILQTESRDAAIRELRAQCIPVADAAAAFVAAGYVAYVESGKLKISSFAHRGEFTFRPNKMDTVTW